jgi:hypothetical protein
MASLCCLDVSASLSTIKELEVQVLSVSGILLSLRRSESLRLFIFNVQKTAETFSVPRLSFFHTDWEIVVVAEERTTALPKFSRSARVKFNVWKMLNITKKRVIAEQKDHVKAIKRLDSS